MTTGALECSQFPQADGEDRAFGYTADRRDVVKGRHLEAAAA